MTMVAEWDRTARLGARAPGNGPAGAARPVLVRLFGFICFWRVGAERRLAAEPIDDHLLRDIGLTRADINLMSRMPRRRP